MLLSNFDFSNMFADGDQPDQLQTQRQEKKYLSSEASYIKFYKFVNSTNVSVVINNKLLTSERNNQTFILFLFSQIKDHLPTYFNFQVFNHLEIKFSKDEIKTRARVLTRKGCFEETFYPNNSSLSKTKNLTTNTDNRYEKILGNISVITFTSPSGKSERLLNNIQKLIYKERAKKDNYNITIKDKNNYYRDCYGNNIQISFNQTLEATLRVNNTIIGKIGYYQSFEGTKPVYTLKTDHYFKERNGMNINKLISCLNSGELNLHSATQIGYIDQVFHENDGTILLSQSVNNFAILACKYRDQPLFITSSLDHPEYNYMIKRLQTRLKSDHTCQFVTSLQWEEIKQFNEYEVIKVSNGKVNKVIRAKNTKAVKSVCRLLFKKLISNGTYYYDFNSYKLSLTTRLNGQSMEDVEKLTKLTELIRLDYNRLFNPHLTHKEHEININNLARINNLALRVLIEINPNK